MITSKKRLDAENGNDDNEVEESELTTNIALH